MSKLKLQNHHNDQIGQHHLKKELWKTSLYAMKTCFIFFFCLYIFVLINEKPAFTFHAMDGERVLPH